LNEQEHHRRAVHGHQLVVHLGSEEGVLGPGELGAHQQCDDADKRTFTAPDGDPVGWQTDVDHVGPR
jgi:hypothetical protein